MKFYYVEVCFDDIWTTVGIGYNTQHEAEWALSKWRQDMQCFKETYFRVRPHILQEPPEKYAHIEWDDIPCQEPPEKYAHIEWDDIPW